MNKSKKVEKVLQSKSITSLEAFEKFRATRLADIVYKMRKRGHNITTEMVEINGIRFAKYRMIK
jgi:hypothetical protein